ncbi:glycoside hydrolase family 88 protein [Micromonospora echinospora]|uniref:Unsaturated rhamnogalacturonyl hydrolase n=1 Tax=Micromonospora echinospora TaxID=1877 RepID=A0ABR6MBT1_MICEC|nr:glycoside hydrolase family 88 protein [Micromonospora echinospora]MBB5112840.1 unsaturated rhamnogalacturonyl hydrolase [Micromonospora echinospora]
MVTTGNAAADRVLLALLTMQRESWEQGILGHALLDLGLDEAAVLVADAAVTRQRPDGRLGETAGSVGAVNGAACGEVVRHAARSTGDPRYAVALDAQLDWLTRRAPRAADGTLFHLLDGRQVWADTVYMVVPLLALTGHAGPAAAQVAGHRERLHDSRTGLYAARWDEDRGELDRPEPWGTGNGWVVAGIARALRLAPDWPGPLRAELAGHVEEVLTACLAYRGADGLFPDVLDDPGAFREANTAQLLGYAALTGVADGWLPRSWFDVGAELLAAAGRRVDGYGRVTGVSGAPDFAGPGTSPEAQACHLLGYAALRRAALNPG